MKCFHLSAAALLTITLAGAQTVTGRWTGNFSTADNGLEIVVALNQAADGAVTGYILSPRSTDTITSGKIEGTTLTLEAERSGRGGAIQKVTYTATVDGGKMKLTVPAPNFGGQGRGRGPGAPGAGPGGPPPGGRTRRSAPGRRSGARLHRRAQSPSAPPRARHPPHAHHARQVQRHGQNPADGLEQLEQVPQPGQRQNGPRDGRRHCPHRHARRRLYLRQYRRHLGIRRPRRRRQYHHQQQIPRHESPRRLHPRQGSQARHLLLPRTPHLRRIPRQLPARRAGRQNLRRLGHRLSEIRLVQRLAGLRQHAGHHGRRLPQDGTRPVELRPHHRLQPLPVRQPRCRRLGREGRRQPVAHHRRHQRPLGLHGKHRLQTPARPREVRRPRTLERPRHARSRQRRHDRHRIPDPHEPMVSAWPRPCSPATTSAT